MEEFFGEQIKVEKAARSPEPVRFTWRSETHEVIEVLEERVDTGYGALPRRSRNWYTRRHRRYFVVRDKKGDVFEIYLDYSNRQKQSWWLVKRFDREDVERERSFAT
jgi:cytochrome oxidase Cu insertion factor (SCO1/SenC/PrrC family)